jgi:pimeloyl-ACP methyl ester carboxylesterase
VTVVFLHALPLDERMWSAQLERFGGVAPRLYGRGPELDGWAESLLREVEGELVLVGASMGGYCALALARREPQRVRGLVLAGSRADADSPERFAARADTIELIRREGARGLWESMRPKLFPADADPDVVERARTMTLDQDSEELVHAVMAIRDRPDSTDVLEALGERSLAIIGDADPFVSVGEVPAHEVRAVRNCGHLPSVQRPEEFDAILEEALARWT